MPTEPLPIPVMRPLLPSAEDVLPRLRRIDAARSYANFGPMATDLEERYSTFLGVSPDVVVTVANATLGLQGAIIMSPATSWVLPSFTFPASALAVVQAGRGLRFEDVDPDSWWLNVDPVLYQGGGVGILPVAPFGSSFSLSKWHPAAEVVIDAAASLGMAMPNLAELPAGWAVVFSLHATKVLPAGEGGIVVFGDAERARRFRAWTNFGFSGTREASIVGTNAKMSEVAAAYAHASLDGWATEQSDWRQAAGFGDAVSREFGISGPEFLRDGVNPYWIASFRNASEARHVESTLNVQGVGNRRWWSRGCHRMPAFQGVPSAPQPNCESVAGKTLGLPMYRGFGEKEAERVHRALSLALR